MRALVENPIARAGLLHHAERAAERLIEIEARLDAMSVDGADIEALNAALIACKDALWAIRTDRIALADAIEDLLDGAAGPAALEAFHSVQVTLVGDRPARGARPRLRRPAPARHRSRSRSRRSHDRPPGREPQHRPACSPRARCGLPNGHLVVRLQDRGRDRRARRQHRAPARRRSAPTSCCISRCAPRRPQATVLAHTRWASVGIISEANAHPLNQEEIDGDGRVDTSRAYTIAALNGDVDNYADLKALDGLHFPAEITTDAKVIPALVARRIGDGRRCRRGVPLHGCRRSRARSRSRSSRPPTPTVCCSRSAAAARRCTSGSRPTRSSSRASRTDSSRSATRYLRLDGETMVDAGNPASQGQVVVLDRRQAGTLGGRAAAVVRRPRPPGRRRRPARRRRSRPATSTAATPRTTS